MAERSELETMNTLRFAVVGDRVADFIRECSNASFTGTSLRLLLRHYEVMSSEDIRHAFRPLRLDAVIIIIDLGSPNAIDDAWRVVQKLKRRTYDVYLLGLVPPGPRVRLTQTRAGVSFARLQDLQMYREFVMRQEDANEHDEGPGQADAVKVFLEIVQTTASHRAFIEDGIVLVNSNNDVSSGVVTTTVSHYSSDCCNVL